MITFYPGPSKIYPQVADYMQEAFSSGILSLNHRSEDFMELMAETLANVKAQLLIPEDYEVYFVSSATECWEVVGQSLIKSKSLHLYNGAFGEKWADYTEKLGITVSRKPFGLNELPVLDEIDTKTEAICLTHNETSNGTTLPDYFLSNLRAHSDSLIAIDATSSMGGVNLKWEISDIWCASVQKCFGLPAGMGILVVSPKAIQAGLEIGEDNHYNSFGFIRNNFQKNQTPYTPNTLHIFMLNRLVSQLDLISSIHKRIVDQAMDLYHFFEKNGIEPLITNVEARSNTVLAIKMEGAYLQQVKLKASRAGLQFGNGYGAWKDTTLRIANFPAITSEDIQILKAFLKDNTQMSSK